LQRAPAIAYKLRKSRFPPLAKKRRRKLCKLTTKEGLARCRSPESREGGSLRQIKGKADVFKRKDASLHNGARKWPAQERGKKRACRGRRMSKEINHIAALRDWGPEERGECNSG